MLTPPLEPLLPKPPTVPHPEEIKVRKWMSYWLLALLTLVVLFALVVLMLANEPGVDLNSKGMAIPNGPRALDAQKDFERLSQLLNIIFGPIIALVSSVVGFYFGARTVIEDKAGR